MTILAQCQQSMIILRLKTRKHRANSSSWICRKEEKYKKTLRREEQSKDTLPPRLRRRMRKPLKNYTSVSFLYAISNNFTFGLITVKTAPSCKVSKDGRICDRLSLGATALSLQKPRFFRRKKESRRGRKFGVARNHAENFQILEKNAQPWAFRDRRHMARGPDLSQDLRKKYPWTACRKCYGGGGERNGCLLVPRLGDPAIDLTGL